MESAKILSCTNCGACCRTFQVLVSEIDSQLEPRIKEESLVIPEWLRTKEYHYKLFPLPFHKQCCFLDSKNLCEIYETRPSVCRKFEPGSEECLVARKNFDAR